MGTWIAWAVLAVIAIYYLVRANTCKIKDSILRWRYVSRSWTISFIALCIAIILQPLYIAINSSLAIVYFSLAIYFGRHGIKHEILEWKEHLATRFKKS